MPADRGKLKGSGREGGSVTPRDRLSHQEFHVSSTPVPFTLEASMLRVTTAVTAIVLAAGAAFAHHGWGSYDAAKPVTVAGPIVTSKYENPHATVTVRSEGKVWTVTLAPRSEER